MSHPAPGREYGENEYPEKGYRPSSKMKHMARKVSSEPINHSMHRIKSGAKKLDKLMKGVGKYNMPN